MRMNSYTRTGPKVTKAVIALVEQQLRSGLPTEYVKFLRVTNGGVPTLRYFSSNDRSGVPYWVDHFLVLDECGVIADGNAHEDSIASMLARIGDTLPKDCIPIGVVSGSDILLLGVDGRRRGGVYLKVPSNLDLFDDPVETRNEAVYRVAPNLEAFLKMLHGEEQK